MMYKHAAKQIKLLRHKHNITQAQLSEALGIGEKYLSAVERKYRKASLQFYKDVANYFKVSLDYLFIDDIDNKKSIFIDSVMIRMSYMDEQDQKMVLKFVEDFSEYISEREKEKE